MSIHIGEIIKTHVESLKVTQKEFGALIYKHEKTVPDIFERATMSIDLLIIISKGLEKDFLNVFYTEEPMKSLREDEITRLESRIKTLTEKTELLIKELTGKLELIDVQKGNLLLVIERLEEFKKNQL